MKDLRFMSYGYTQNKNLLPLPGQPFDYSRKEGVIQSSHRAVSMITTGEVPEPR